MKIGDKDFTISPSSFALTMRLQRAIANAIKGDGIKFDLSSIDLGAENIEKMELGDIGWIIDPILSLATNEEVQTILFECCKSALIGKDKINPDFFESEDNRKYYYPIMFEVIKTNLTPFFGLAGSLFSKLPEITGKFLKSK